MGLCPEISPGVLLAPLTTLGVGGPAWGAASAATPKEVALLLEAAKQVGRPVLVLGGGSNVVVADAGFPGLVLKLTDRRIDITRHGDEAGVYVGAGVRFDRVVEVAVFAGLSGLEALSGIPGLAGAAPVQNIGAYGQELSEVLTHVRAVDRETLEEVVFEAEECGFGYRESRFKGEWRGRYVITGIELSLKGGVPPVLRYEELARRLERLPADPALALSAVRDAVLSLRASKSMLHDPTDPNSKSVGSFFMNPIVAAEEAELIQLRATRKGLGVMPRFAAAGGQVKLAAAWLIEKAGFPKGWGTGSAGISTRHTLAIVNRGTALAEDILSVARAIRRGVREAFGVTLAPEAELVGFEKTAEELLA